MRRAAARALHPGPTKCSSHDRRDGTLGTQGTERSARAEKQCICRRRKSTCLYVCCNRLADLLSQRQPCLTAAFAADMNPCGLPVDILQTHLHDVTCAKTKTGQQKKYGSIPLANMRRRIAAGDEALHILRWQISGQRRQAPMRYDGNSVQQAGTATTLCDQKPQKHTQNRPAPLC